jgi:aryl-alcohol dehydrogenase-like predicted oxidoreductase
LAGIADLDAASGDLLRAIAAGHDASVQRVVLAWLLEASDAVVVIVGSRHPATIEDSARPVALAADELAALDRIASERAGTTRSDGPVD